jgi:hypothetical protein
LTDNWIQQPLKEDFPKLYSFATNKAVSVSMVYSQQHHLHRLFTLPLSEEAYDQLKSIQSFLDHFPLIDQKDK